MDRKLLKKLGVAAMTADHLGFWLGTGSGWYLPLRFFGCLAAPVMCLLLAESFIFTSSRKKYGLRLLLAGLFSQFPYALFVYGQPSLQQLNMIITLFLSFGILYLQVIRIPDIIRTTLVLTAGSLTLVCDWGISVPLWTYFLYIYRDDKKRCLKSFLQVASVTILFSVLTDIPGHRPEETIRLLGLLLFSPVIRRYNRNLITSGPEKWFYYFYYPGHLLVLYLIRGLYT